MGDPPPNYAFAPNSRQWFAQNHTGPYYLPTPSDPITLSVGQSDLISFTICSTSGRLGVGVDLPAFLSSSDNSSLADPVPRAEITRSLTLTAMALGEGWVNFTIDPSSDGDQTQPYGGFYYRVT